jgi:phenylacetate-CoA ligase
MRDIGFGRAGVAMSESEFQKPPEVRSRQEKGFAALMRPVLQGNPFYRKKYGAVGFASERPVGLSDLASLPLLDRPELLRDQQSNPPFGTNLTFPVARYTRIHQGAGTSLRWLDTDESWSWWLECWKEAYEAAGVGAQHHVLVACATGPSIGFWSALEAGQRVGALMIPGGTAPVEGQLEMMLQYQATVLVTTPRNALSLSEAAHLGGYDLASCALRIILHSDESAIGPPEDATGSETWGGRRVDVALDTEIGAWAYGCGQGDLLHVNEGQFVAEVVDPAGGEPAPVDDHGAQRGELVLTNLGRAGSPLIRYRTGHVVELSRRPCACGRRTAVLARGAITSREGVAA